jgi:hypothetical protein
MASFASDKNLNVTTPEPGVNPTRGSISSLILVPEAPPISMLPEGVAGNVELRKVMPVGAVKLNMQNSCVPVIPHPTFDNPVPDPETGLVRSFIRTVPRSVSDLADCATANPKSRIAADIVILVFTIPPSKPHSSSQIPIEDGAN